MLQIKSHIFTINGGNTWTILPSSIPREVGGGGREKNCYRMESKAKERKLLSLTRQFRDRSLRSRCTSEAELLNLSTSEGWNVHCALQGARLWPHLLDARGQLSPGSCSGDNQRFSRHCSSTPWRGRRGHHCSKVIIRVCQRQIFTLISGIFTLTMTISTGIFLLPNKKIPIYTHDLLVYDILTVWSRGAYQS